jgi:hypothetical protein
VKLLFRYLFEVYLVVYQNFEQVKGCGTYQDNKAEDFPEADHSLAFNRIICT